MIQAKKPTQGSREPKHRQTFDTVYQIVGQIDKDAICELLGLTFPTEEVRMYPGVIKHLQRRHPGIYERYAHLIPLILFQPDYVGQNPKVPDSLEFYKRVSEDLLLAIKLDPTGYLFLSSFYEMQNFTYKLESRLRTGRVVKFRSHREEWDEE